MTAPERIWIDAWGGNWSPQAGGTQGVEYVRADLAAVQPAQVRVKPLDKSTLQSVYENTPDIAGLPDAYQPRNIASALEVFRASATEPQPDPRDEVITRLVEAAQVCVDTFTSSEHSDLRAALAAAKAVQK